MYAANEVSSKLVPDGSASTKDGRGRLARWLDGVATTVLSVGLVALLRWWLHSLLEEGLAYTMFLASVALSTHRAGWRCGVAVTGLSVVVATYLFVPPDFSAMVYLGPHVVLSIVVFVASAFLVIWVMNREASARRRLQEREWLLRSSHAERTALSRQLEEARKMESLGRLAGGVAHDFNNLTTVILGSADLLHKHLPDNPLLDAIILAATRATEITKQLLGLGRRQMMVLQTMSIEDVAGETVRLCERLFPENISLRVVLDEKPWPFRGDVTLVQQILLNLLTNARDAMPDGGVVELEVRNVTLDDGFALQHPEVKQGDYLCIRVKDSGVGMDADTQQRAFEPFFTGKRSGTGLGLAVVYGLVMQLEGAIRLDSKLGAGTSFDVFLPRVREEVSELTSLPPQEHSDLRLRVLLAEDHELVRGVLERMLRGLGHDAMVAQDGRSALELARAEAPPDVLVTDIGMPGMDGSQLAELLRMRFPALGVVLISGYDDSEKLHRVQSEFGFVFLRKPFTAHELNEAVVHAKNRAEKNRPRISSPFGLHA
jgi:signal transduction histidine kinase/CheY-like chemotaxis protein